MGRIGEMRTLMIYSSARYAPPGAHHEGLHLPLDVRH